MLRQIFTTYLARFAAIGSTLLLVPIVAPAVGIDRFGLYALVSSMGVLFAQDLGMASATTKFAAQAHAVNDMPHLRQVAAATTVYFAVTATLLSAALAVGFAVVVPQLDVPTDVDVKTLCTLGVLNVFFGMALSPHRQLMAGVNRLAVVNYVLIAQAGTRVVVTGLAITVSPSIEAVAAIDLGTTVTAGIAIWVLRRRQDSSTNSRISDFEWSTFKALFTFSLDLLVMTVAAVIILQSGALLASLLLPLGAVAIYTAANRAFLLVREASNSLTLAMLPSSSANAARGDLSANSNVFLQGTRFANFAMIILLVPVIAFCHELLQWWVGRELASGYLAAQVLILSMLANNNHILAVPILTALGKIRSFAKLHTVWAIAGIAIATPLAQAYGTTGIALALSLPVIVLEPIYVSIALKSLGIGPTTFVKQAILRPYLVALLPTAAMICASIFLGPGDAQWIIFGVVVWLVLMMALGWRFVLSETERSRMRRSVAVSANRDRPAA